MTKLGWFTDLKTTYLSGESVAVTDLPESTARCVVRTAMGDVIAAKVVGDQTVFENLPVGTHAMEALSNEGEILYQEFFGVRKVVGDDPVMGFATSFDHSSVPSTLRWLRDLRCTVVQMYDWMESYSEPLSDQSEYDDPLGRRIERSALIQLIEGIKEFGSIAQAYAPVIASDEELAEEKPEWRLFRNDGAPQSLGDLLQIMDPGSTGWQSHWLDRYGGAANTLGFNGFHLDTYGYPRVAFDKNGDLVDVTAGYASFVAKVREERVDDVVSFNQVNGVPRRFSQDGLTNFHYVEVWPPNQEFRHFEGLLQRSSRNGAIEGSVLAVYPPVWSGDRQGALRTCIVVEAILTLLGASALMWGDCNGVLSHPYYVNHEILSDEERSTALEWHRFGLRCRDLFRTGIDTSWFELDDENSSVSVSWEGQSRPEPVAGSLFVRVRRTATSVVVGLLDMSGSTDGSWSSQMDRGRVSHAKVEALLESPEKWRIEYAAVECDAGRFSPLDSSPVVLREGIGVACRVPLSSGWSVVRMVLTEEH